MPRSTMHMKVRAGPSGVLLFDRNTGLNVLFDEVVTPRELWAKAPRQVSIALTNACDLSCAHCFASKMPARLDYDATTSWLAELDAHAALGVGFGGGEPTLYPRFVDLCRFAAGRTSLAVTFTTHAHHVNNELCDSLRGLIHFVRVSMDGVGATYESIRGRSFAGLLAKLRVVAELSRFGINYVVNRQTVGDLDVAAKLAADVGASELLLLPERPTASSHGIDNESMSRLQLWVEGYRGRTRLAISDASTTGFPTCDPMRGDSELDAYVHIDAMGVLKRTSFDKRGVHIGDDGVIAALRQLREQTQETNREDLARLRI